MKKLEKQREGHDFRNFLIDSGLMHHTKLKVDRLVSEE